MSQTDSQAAINVAFLEAIPSGTIMLMIDACSEAAGYISSSRSHPFAEILDDFDIGEAEDCAPRLSKMDLLRITFTLDVLHLATELKKLDLYLADWGHSMLYRQLEKLRPGHFRERLFGADLGL